MRLSLMHAPLLVAIAILSSCAQSKFDTDARLPIKDRDYELSIYDDVEQSRFYIEFTSLSEHDICIPQDAWPASKELADKLGVGVGSMHFMQEYVYVISGEQKIHLKRTNLGYCIPEIVGEKARCLIVVRPGEKTSGSIPYDEFDGDIRMLPVGSRHLVFPVRARFCAYYMS